MPHDKLTNHRQASLTGGRHIHPAPTGAGDARCTGSQATCKVASRVLSMDGYLWLVLHVHDIFQREHVQLRTLARDVAVTTSGPWRTVTIHALSRCPTSNVRRQPILQPYHSPICPYCASSFTVVRFPPFHRQQYSPCSRQDYHTVSRQAPVFMRWLPGCCNSACSITYVWDCQQSPAHHHVLHVIHCCRRH